MARTALVTGASRGIGRSVALALARDGCRLLLHHRDNEPGIAELARVLADGGVDHLAVRADLAAPDAVDRIAGHLAASWRQVDILVNNAGAYERTGFDGLSAEQWGRTVALNMTAPFLLAKAFVPGMVARGWGRIVNVSSILAFRGSTHGADYAAAKAGVVGLTRALARETAASGVTVNAVAPGAIRTDIIAGDTPEQRAAREAVIPLKRVGAPDEVASVVRFLASDDAAAVTGQTVHVNGGWWMV